MSESGEWLGEEMRRVAGLVEVDNEASILASVRGVVLVAAFPLVIALTSAGLKPCDAVLAQFETVGRRIALDDWASPGIRS